MPNWAQNGPKWSKTCYIDHLGSFWALLDRFGTLASLPCSAIFGLKRAIMIRGSQKGGGGGGGGADVWEKFPNNIVFFFESVPKDILELIFEVQHFVNAARVKSSLKLTPCRNYELYIM